ncbi:hypothetical protein AXF42_Ash021436 [Apostasia shenzhenica]|uniref:Uncharacterized protein n=1 Tax=Apostasia shenzhenica TaxID=1088818 RepID=A0A2H9ZRC5_9ASPA|nr:hypothetical protein AXF42_Ash021436 [Apostasia shenzhenica]
MMIQDHLPATLMMMFPSYTYRCQRVTTSPFSMQHASFSHANQGPACFSHHGPLKELPRSKSQALFPLLPAPPVVDSGGTTSVDSAIEYFIIFRKTRTELHYLLLINIL